MRRQVLAIVSNKIEAKKALEILNKEKNFTIIASSLEAEFCIKQKLDNWQNPLYEFVLKPKFKSKDYTFRNFNLASDFCNDKYLRHFKIRLGYFLAELERSLDLANAMLQKYKPSLLLIGNIKNYPGSSVVDGTLKTNAFWLLAKEQKIPHQLIGKNNERFSLRQIVGKKIQLFRYLGRQKIDGGCDLLILATPSHLIQMAPLINEIKASGLKVKLLTYHITIAFKKVLDKNFPDYLEKERLMDVSLKSKSEKARDMLIKSTVWKKFNAHKYRKKPILLNYIRLKIEDIIKNEALEVIRDLFLADVVLSKIKPKALLVTTDPDSKVLPYVNWAKESKIKTICIQHGAFYGKDSPAIYPQSDFFIAWSVISKNWLKKTDFFKEVKILIGRSPFHFRKILKLKRTLADQKKITILFLATKQPTVEKGLVLLYLRKLFETISKINLDFQILIRVHPYQDTTNLKSLMENSHDQVSFANDCSLEEAINKSAIVIYENTTAGFDAMFAGKPTIYFNPYSGEDFYDVKKNKASLPIINLNDLEKKLPEFIRNKKQMKIFSTNGQRFTEDYLGINQPLSKLSNVIIRITMGK